MLSSLQSQVDTLTQIGHGSRHLPPTTKQLPTWFSAKKERFPIFHFVAWLAFSRLPSVICPCRSTIGRMRKYCKFCRWKTNSSASCRSMSRRLKSHSVKNGSKQSMLRNSCRFDLFTSQSSSLCDICHLLPLIYAVSHIGEAFYCTRIAETSENASKRFDLSLCLSLHLFLFVV